MSLKTKQSLSINNKLAMTQQIQLAIKLLQLNSIDLQKEIEDKILENPFATNFFVIFCENIRCVHKFFFV